MDFESLYTNIPVEDAIELMNKIVFQFRNIISNAHFVIALLEIVLKNGLRTSDKEYFQQIFGTILANLYLAMFQEELKRNHVEYMDIYIYTKEKNSFLPDFWIFEFSKKI